MKGRSIRIRDTEHWHELRASHVGGSEAAIVLGAHPNRTLLDLWAEKAGKVKPQNLDSDERVYFGKLLEPIVAKATAERTGWTVKKVKRYLSGMPESRCGASLDYEVTCPDRGPGVLEIKCADRIQFAKWDVEEGAPLHYQCQLQMYLGLTGKAWGAIAVLVGGNRLEIFEYERRDSLIELIETEVEKFWESVERDAQPEPDFERDAKLISLLYKKVDPGKLIELPPDGQAAELAAIYVDAQAKARDADKVIASSRAKLLTLLGDANVATAGNFRITSSYVQGKPEWRIGFSDVGRVIFGRNGYRTLSVREKL